MIGRCSCARHAAGYYWWYLWQLTLCVETIVLCKWFYQKGGFQLPMYASYELKIVFSKQTTCYVEFYQHHLLLKCLRFLTTYVVMMQDTRYQNKLAKKLSLWNEHQRRYCRLLSLSSYRWVSPGSWNVLDWKSCNFSSFCFPLRLLWEIMDIFFLSRRYDWWNWCF